MPATHLGHVLIIDDDASTRSLLRDALEDAGYAVSEAEEGKAALDCLCTSRQRMVVLLDVQLPGISGFEVLGLVAADASLATRHAYILMTASSKALPPAMTDVCTRLGVPFFAKPFDVFVLLEAVAQAATRLPQASL